METTGLMRAGRYIVIAAALLLGLFILAQVAQIVSLTSSFHPVVRTVIGVGLLAAFAWIIAVPVLAYLRMEPAIIPPAEATGPRHDAFVAAYLAACRRNPLLDGHDLNTEADLLDALRHLETEAERIANRTASQVFIGTAVSQYGSLDALIVAATQIRMTWQIAHVYQRRPSLRQVGYLYSNVLATSLAATQVDRIDLSEYLRPVLAGVLGQSVAAVPGVAALSSHVTNAVFSGSVNAFLTLRVAMVAIAYSKATVKPERRSVWSSALARAGTLVARTVAAGTVQVSKAFAVAAGKSAADAAVSVGTAVVRGGQRVGSEVARTADAVGTAAGQAAKAAGGGLASGAATIVSAVKSKGKHQSPAPDGAGAAETKPKRLRRRPTPRH